MKNDHLWRILVTRGVFPSKDEAVRWILAGKVRVNGEGQFNSGNKFPLDALIEVKGLGKRYVGKGGIKLEGALRDFELDITGVVALDAGASTGGFTDCLLQHGAARVYSVDAGYGQLAGSLRTDSRVVNMEKTNISDIPVLEPPALLAVADLSYLSLRKAIPVLAGVAAPGADLICLVKPLFETEKSEPRRTGRIDDPDEYKKILMNLVDFAYSSNVEVNDVAASQITGNKGTIEFFIKMTNQPSKEIVDHSRRIKEAVEGALANPVFGVREM
ncbi:MAG: TlyA family RNA methyltransferase [Spirochaetales bacterium]|jgi:23S rRNA (cytidine1920-2'-O)/16S rRNA (cytidine1409-2'-O)-methyltransferase|nr:TlyA family RNA methyltransferase [Spirochaetales bacterium]